MCVYSSIAVNCPLSRADWEEYDIIATAGLKHVHVWPAGFANKGSFILLHSSMS